MPGVAPLPFVGIIEVFVWQFSETDAIDPAGGTVRKLYATESRGPIASSCYQELKAS